MTPEELGRIGYEAYGAHADWKAYDGKPMPKWDELRLDIKEKWAVAAKAIAKAATEPMKPVFCKNCVFAQHVHYEEDGKLVAPGCTGFEPRD